MHTAPLAAGLPKCRAWGTIPPIAKLTVQKIRELALDIVAQTPGGVRYQPLRTRILEQHPETNSNTISGAIWNLDAIFPDKITKPSRGLFKAAGTDLEGDVVAFGVPVQTGSKGKKINESDFYDGFADWLRDDLGEVTVAKSLGGASLKSKWGTPDVVGVYKPLGRDLIKFPLELVAAEIKIDPQAPVVAFGQAIAYRLFASKTYIAMPNTLTEEDQSRLEALCMLFGVGLALFNLDPEKPEFTVRVRAQRFSPDMFYVNEFADRLKKSDLELFENLFG